MAMKAISCNIAKAVSAFCLFSLTASVTKAQEDRAERLQESVSSSDQRTDFSARKAAPSKIDSFAFQELLAARSKCKKAERYFAKLQATYGKKQLKGTLSSADKRKLNEARVQWDNARAAVTAAERKANAD